MIRLICLRFLLSYALTTSPLIRASWLAQKLFLEDISFSWLDFWVTDSSFMSSFGFISLILRIYYRERFLTKDYCYCLSSVSFLLYSRFIYRCSSFNFNWNSCSNSLLNESISFSLSDDSLLLCISDAVRFSPRIAFIFLACWSSSCSLSISTNIFSISFFFYSIVYLYISYRQEVSRSLIFFLQESASSQQYLTVVLRFEFSCFSKLISDVRFSIRFQDCLVIRAIQYLYPLCSFSVSAWFTFLSFSMSRQMFLILALSQLLRSISRSISAVRSCRNMGWTNSCLATMILLCSLRVSSNCSCILPKAYMVFIIFFSSTRYLDFSFSMSPSSREILTLSSRSVLFFCSMILRAWLQLEFKVLLSNFSFLQLTAILSSCRRIFSSSFRNFSFILSSYSSFSTNSACITLIFASFIPNTSSLMRFCSDRRANLEWSSCSSALAASSWSKAVWYLTISASYPSFLVLSIFSMSLQYFLRKVSSSSLELLILLNWMRFCSLLLKKDWQLSSLLVLISIQRLSCSILTYSYLQLSCRPSYLRWIYSIFLLWQEFSETMEMTLELKFFFYFQYYSITFLWSDSRMYSLLFSQRVIWYSEWVSLEDFSRNSIMDYRLTLSLSHSFSLFFSSAISFCASMAVNSSLLFMVMRATLSLSSSYKYSLSFLADIFSNTNSSLSLY